MEILMLILSVAQIAMSITVSSNGNSPKMKMIGGMMVDIQKGFVPITVKTTETPLTTQSNYVKSRKVVAKTDNTTKLSLNERYRRLIPYMTFYYANDLVAPTTEAVNNVEVQKAEIVEAATLGSNHRQPKKIFYSGYRNIPRYQGNRLTSYNIASANPTNVYKDVPTYQNTGQVSQNYNHFLEHNTYTNQDNNRFVQKHIGKIRNLTPPRNPHLEFYQEEQRPNVHYYFPEKEVTKYKLVPYEQTPPVKVPQIENVQEIPKKHHIAVPVVLQKEPIYVKPRPFRPIYYYDESDIPQTPAKKPPTTISEVYYEKQGPRGEINEPIVESGFQPIVSPMVATTEAPIYTSTYPEAQPQVYYENEKPVSVQIAEPTPTIDTEFQPKYYQYFVEQPIPKATARPTNPSIASLLNALQLKKSTPKPVVRPTVATSIRTLLQMLNALTAEQSQKEMEVPLLSSPKPFVANPNVIAVTAAPEAVEITPSSLPVVEVSSAAAAVTPHIDDAEFQEEHYLAPVETPSQHLDDLPNNGLNTDGAGGSTQRFPQPIHSDNEGGTPGRPDVDYPVLTSIPPTSFNCKTQRYKGFFADPETRCQVWHYCDLNGGQASFLCPNGTIFSQAGLTCDWWFNVRCDSTTQLYVLNESLYKYILPHSPKFPEDYSGPLVDKYLTLKFKEMEEQFRKNKNKQAAEKIDSDEAEDSKEEEDKSEVTTVSEPSVIVESPGTSGQVERLQD